MLVALALDLLALTGGADSPGAGRGALHGGAGCGSSVRGPDRGE